MRISFNHPEHGGLPPLRDNLLVGIDDKQIIDENTHVVVLADKPYLKPQYFQRYREGGWTAKALTEAALEIYRDLYADEVLEDLSLTALKRCEDGVWDICVEYRP